MERRLVVWVSPTTASFTGGLKPSVRYEYTPSRSLQARGVLGFAAGEGGMLGVSDVQIIEVQERTDELVDQLLDVWERSVRATHDFLTEAGVERIKGYVPDALRGARRLFVARDADGKPLAFMGVQDGFLEMLFVAPEARGQGIGSTLLRHGITELDVRELSVNEQNPGACGFYEHMGFVTYKRTDTDEQGDPYPLLYMRLR